MEHCSRAQGGHGDTSCMEHSCRAAQGYVLHGALLQGCMGTCSALSSQVQRRLSCRSPSESCFHPKCPLSTGHSLQLPQPAICLAGHTAVVFGPFRFPVWGAGNGHEPRSACNTSCRAQHFQRYWLLILWRSSTGSMFDKPRLVQPSQGAIETGPAQT